MRAMVVTGPGMVRVADVPTPQPGPGQVLIRLEGCGVCASNLEPWAGPTWMPFPTVPGGLGHEGWGLVEAVGPEVIAVAPGDRVAALSSNAYAEFDLADAAAVVPLPPALDDLPFPGEAFGCAFNIFRRSDLQPGQTIVIIGIGFLGAVLTRLASQAGARVIAIGRRPFALDLARRLGAAETIPMVDLQAIIEEVRRLTDGRFAERVIEAVGKQWPLDLAGELVGEGGRLVIAGYHQDGPRQINMQLWNWRGIDVVNAHERNPATYVAGIEAAIAAVEQGLIDPRDYLTHRFSLEELGDALDATRDRPDGFLKAWVSP